MENQNDHFRLNQLHSPHPEITQTDARRMLQEFHTLYNTAEGEGRSLYPPRRSGTRAGGAQCAGGCWRRQPRRV